MAARIASAFEPTIVPWSEKLPADVHFVRLPALFGGIWNVHGQMFLTLESMGVEHDVHNAVFEAIHKEHKKLATRKKWPISSPARAWTRKNS